MSDSPHPHLTWLEREALSLLASRWPLAEVRTRLALSEQTLASLVRSVLRKFRAVDLQQAVHRALESHLIAPAEGFTQS